MSKLYMEILKIGPYLENGSAYSKNKLNFDPWGGKRVYVQLPVTFTNDQVSCPKYGSFENWSAFRKPLTVE